MKTGFLSPNFYQLSAFMEDQFQSQDDCQNLQDYGPDGYHPVVLGQRFKDMHYVVRQKLGWGHFSTVWLVEDPNSKNFALKIQRSKKSHAETALDQLQILNTIKSHTQDQEWIKFREEHDKLHPLQPYSGGIKCVYHLDNFPHFGPFGKHYCTVFHLLGPNLLDLIQHYEFKELKMPIWLVKVVTRQVLMGLIYLHEFAKVVHTDLKPENIMLQFQEEMMNQFISELKKYSKKPMSMKYLKLKNSSSNKNKKKYQKKKLKKLAQQEPVVNSPDEQPTPEREQSKEGECEQSKREEGEGKEEARCEKTSGQNSQRAINRRCKKFLQVQDQQIELNSLNWKGIRFPIDERIKVKIVDFGNACWTHKKFTEKIQTREYRSPEVIIGVPFRANTDIWSLACIVFQMLTSHFLFKPKQFQGVTKNMDHLNLMYQLLGSFPKSFVHQGQFGKSYFNKKCQLAQPLIKQVLSLSQVLHKEYQYSKSESEEIQQFLLPMLQYDPLKRASAKQMINHKWLWN